MQNFKRWFTKSDFDFDARHIGIFDLHPQIRVIFAMNGIFFNNKDSKLRFLLPLICVSLGIVAIVFELMHIVHSIATDDLSMATECFSYFMTVAVVLFVHPCTLLGRQKIFEYVDQMACDFEYVCTLEPRFRDKFLAGQLEISQMGILWFGFITFVAILYCMMTFVELLYMSLLATQDEHTVRPLIFPLWLPKDDPYRSPNYELLLITMIFVIVDVLLTFGGYVYIMFHFLLHGLIQLDMVILALGSLFDGLDERVAYLDEQHLDRRRVRAVLTKRFERIVNWHNAVFSTVDMVVAIYSPVMVYQLLLSSVALCLNIYQVADQLDKGKVDVMFALLSVGVCLQVWIMCYLGTLLENKGFLVGEACWNSGWETSPLSRLVRADLCLVIMRSQRPIQISVTAIPVPSLQTFSSIITSAFSYFNMVRQMKEDT